ncbi:Uncharacterised protein [Klebsiella pneumoniae]|nr:Uncharacterised protein [Klebsiella pneumoniae]
MRDQFCQSLLIFSGEAGMRRAIDIQDADSLIVHP